MDFNFKGFDVETDLEAAWIFNWPSLIPELEPSHINGMNQLVGAVPDGGSPSNQPSLFMLMNLDNFPWSEEVLRVADGITPAHIQVDVSGLSSPEDYTAYTILYNREEDVGSATT